MKFRTLTTIGLFGLAAVTGAAQAGTVNSQLFPGMNWLSDNSAEYLINADGGNDTILDVNDRLRGIFTIETVEDTSGGTGTTNHLGAGSGNNELSGIFDIQVTSKTGFDLNGDAVDDLFAFSFASSGTLDGYAVGAMAVFFEDTAYEFSRLGGTVAGHEADITDGTLFWAMGLDGVDDFWTATTVTDDIAVVGATTSPNTGGSYNAGLSLLLNNSGYAYNAIGCLGATVDACASGSLLGTGGVNTPYDSFDNVDFVMNRVPEPASLALLAIGLLGIGATARARKA